MITSMFIARHYMGERDIQSIVDLFNACESVDQIEEGTSVEEIQQELKGPDLDLERDLCLWEDGDGHLVGFAELWFPEPGSEGYDGFLTIKIHPAVRGTELEAQILAWAEERGRAFGCEHGAPVNLRTRTRDTQHEHRAMLEQRGFTVSRSFFHMARALAEPIPQPQFPAGFTLRTVQLDDPLEQHVALFNEAFIDHWNHHPLTVEQIQYFMQGPHYCIERDLVAIAPDGTYAAFCYCHINPEENARTGRNAGYIQVLGTRRGYRRIGLGHAMLLAGLQRLKADGVTTALLGVDTCNPSGALELYESVGFAKFTTMLSYGKTL